MAATVTSPQSEKLKKRIEYAGPYRLLETVGTGGMATVKVAMDPMNGRKVAVKIVDKEKLHNPREQVSMAREITIMKLLRHPNVLRLYDIYETEDKILMIMDYYPGGDLYHLITEGGALRPSLARRLFQQLIAGIEFCHEHMIIHRDLKPENLLLSADHQTLVLSDFGLSTAMLGSRRFLKTRCGTVHYIAPEVAKGEEYVGMASDVWSCGVILFTMVTASLPFDGDTAVDVLKKIARGDFVIPTYLPLELQDLLTRMLWGDPQERITTKDIKTHPWLTSGVMNRPPPFSLVSDVLEDLFSSLVPELPPPPSPHDVNTPISAEIVEAHPQIVDNLVLLGWERDELIQILVSPERDIAKIFFNLLMERTQKKKEEPKAVTSKDILHSGNPTRHRRSNSTGGADGERVIVSAVPKEKPTQIPEGGPEVVVTKPENSKLSRQIRRVAAPADGSTRLPEGRARSSTNEKNARPADAGPLSPTSDAYRRRATVGEGTAPLQPGFWGLSPSKNPNAKIYSAESGKSINQIFDNLKTVFDGLDADVKVSKKKSGGVKVVASHKDANGKKSKIKVSVQEKEPGKSVVTIKNLSSGKQGAGDLLQEVEKKLDI